MEEDAENACEREYTGLAGQRQGKVLATVLTHIYTIKKSLARVSAHSGFVSMFTTALLLEKRYLVLFFDVELSRPACRLVCHEIVEVVRGARRSHQVLHQSEPLRAESIRAPNVAAERPYLDRS